jgi:ResB-like family
MNPVLRRLRNFFVSLQLTVVLLVMSMVLVFVATLDQVNLGIWVVQEKYFRSLFVLWPLPNSNVSIPIFPGGYLVGSFLLVNLVAAHLYRFKLSWKKAGILIAHTGLILLLVGELLTSLLQKDSAMRIEEGETRKYSESFRDYELALLDKTNPDYDEVVAIPDTVLADKTLVQHPKLPFQVRVKEYFPNANVQMRDASEPALPGITGIGARVALVPLPVTSKPEEVNSPGVYVELVSAEGSLGTWLVSPLLGMPQTLNYQGHAWELALRLKRFYQPFSLSLLKVTHDVYPGTDIPKNFASRVRVRDDAGRTDREVNIFMNNPLRFGGMTFYQYQMNAEEHLSVFQVVRNPSWLLPYIACAMMGFGLLFQFVLSLSGFMRKRAATAKASSE